MKNPFLKILQCIIFLIITCNICYANNILNNNSINNFTLLNISIIIIFIACYTLIILEEKIKIKKSTISIIFASLLWITIACFFQEKNENKIINLKIHEILSQYCELFLFLFTAIIYINSIKYLDIINIIKYKLNLKNISHKKIYWITGLLAFFISPIADNLTTALLICTILMSLEKKDKQFINLASINIVIASNAGGVFSPFGDITTLMIWQNNLLNFSSFFKIFIPSLINFIIPSLIISFKIKNKQVQNKDYVVFTQSNPKYTLILTFIFLGTITLTILIQTYLKIPSIIGMMLGLSILNIFEKINNNYNNKKFYLTNEIKKIDWDTLLFFYGIMLCIGALSVTGLLNDLSTFIYNDLIKEIKMEYKYIPANIILGLLSSIIDNIPITYAVLEMNLNMSEGQWLLITLTTGTGGSLLSIGSSAGIALMGYTNGKYTFISHLKWSWAILLGYFSSIAMHIVINNSLFT